MEESLSLQLVVHQVVYQSLSSQAQKFHKAHHYFLSSQLCYEHSQYMRLDSLLNSLVGKTNPKAHCIAKNYPSNSSQNFQQPEIPLPTMLDSPNHPHIEQQVEGDENLLQQILLPNPWK